MLSDNIYLPEVLNGSLSVFLVIHHVYEAIVWGEDYTHSFDACLILDQQIYCDTLA